MSEYFKIGKLAASHGLEGLLVLQHSLGKKTKLDGLKAIFLQETANNFIPYFIEHTKIKNDDQVYVKLEGIDTKESARKFTPKEVWLQDQDFKKFTEKSAPIALLGFTVYDGKNKIGIITEVIEQPHQILAVVMYKEKEVYLPVHADTLIKMDVKNKSLYLILPDGLLDVYLL